MLQSIDSICSDLLLSNRGEDSPLYIFSVLYSHGLQFRNLASHLASFAHCRAGLLPTQYDIAQSIMLNRETLLMRLF